MRSSVRPASLTFCHEALRCWNIYRFIWISTNLHLLYSPYKFHANWQMSESQKIPRNFEHKEVDFQLMLFKCSGDPASLNIHLKMDENIIIGHGSPYGWVLEWVNIVWFIHSLQHTFCFSSGQLLYFLNSSWMVLLHFHFQQVRSLTVENLMQCNVQCERIIIEMVTIKGLLLNFTVSLSLFLLKM